MRNFIIYIIFLSITTFVVFGGNPVTTYYFTKAVKDVFIEKEFSINDHDFTFKEIYTINHTWEYLENVFLNGIYWYLDTENHQTDTSIEPDDAKVLFENKLLGVPRLRQLRVKNDSCLIHKAFEQYFVKCYSDYSSKLEDMTNFGKGFGTEWTYSDAEKLNGSAYWGHFTLYGGGGYYIDLPVHKNETLNVLKELKHNKWLDRGTRVLFVDFTLYNANSNIFSIVKLVFERSSVGNIVSTWSIATENLLRYVDQFDYIIMAFEIIFVVFIIFLTFEEFANLCRFRLKYFKKFWNIFDVIILVVSYAVIAFNLHSHIYLQNNLKSLLQRQDQFLDFEELGSATIKMNGVTAIFVFLLWMKLFKYLSFNNTMQELIATLSRCAKDIFSFALMFFIVFCAFAQMGTLFLGMKVYNYSTFGISMFTLLRTILGDFDYQEIENSDRVLGPIFFLFYIFFVFFVLMNMFLAILTETYTKIKSEEPETDDSNVLKIIIDKCNKLCPMVGKFGNDQIFKRKNNHTINANETKILDIENQEKANDNGLMDAKPNIHCNQMIRKNMYTDIDVPNEIDIKSLLNHITTMKDHTENMMTHVTETLHQIQDMTTLLLKAQQTRGRGTHSSSI